MTANAVLLLLVFAFGASFTQRVTGFGFGIFIMTVLPYLMPSFGEATALSGVLAVVCVLVTACKHVKYIQWKKLLPILITFLVVSFFSVRAVAGLDGHLLKRALGGILIAVSIWFFLFSERVRMRPSIPVQLGMGTISGLMGGFFAMQGPPAVVYFLSCTDDKEQYISLISAYFVIGNIMMTVFRAASGLVTTDVLKAALIGLPAVILGLWTGRKVYARMPIAAIRKAVYAFMAVAGAIALIAG